MPHAEKNVVHLVPSDHGKITGRMAWQAHAFIRTPQQVIRRQLSHPWATFYCQSPNWLSSWSGGQLNCRSSPARAWVPEANQCGFASASSALE
ncbi:hypothetical protein O181_108205 [Austropuccinia psidii MF-1]|uniref:Uncharacterized protein n=1 Tax=Austropuccinia psidii MF-1 TaxID=1389203 RepID=A0A9Q3PPD3_9BASI|nr:hypothetical protein [Austropuccinia psidii MF-1]